MNNYVLQFEKQFNFRQMSLAPEGDRTSFTTLHSGLRLSNAIQHNLTSLTGFLVVLDPSLMDQRGHHFHFTQAIVTSAVSHQIGTRVLANKVFVDDGYLPGTEVISCMPDTHYGGSPQDDIVKQVAAELLRNVALGKIAADDTMLVHTADACTYAALTEFLDKSPVLPSAIHICTPYDENMMPFIGRYGKLGRLIGRLSGHTRAANRIFLWAETPALARHIQQQTGSSVGVLSMAVSMDLPQPRVREGAGPLQVMVLGAARDEKGFIILPEILDRMKGAYQSRIHFHIQCSPPIVGYSDTVSRAIESLNAHSCPYLTLYRNSLPRDKFMSLIDQADVLLLPYEKQRYFRRGSGLAVESLASGKILICTEDTFPASLANFGVILSGSNAREFADRLSECEQAIKCLSMDAFHRAETFRGNATGSAYLTRLALRVADCKVEAARIKMITDMLKSGRSFVETTPPTLKSQSLGVIAEAWTSQLQPSKLPSAPRRVGKGSKKIGLELNLSPSEVRRLELKAPILFAARSSVTHSRFLKISIGNIEKGTNASTSQVLATSANQRVWISDASGGAVFALDEAGPFQLLPLERTIVTLALVSSNELDGAPPTLAIPASLADSAKADQLAYSEIDERYAHVWIKLNLRGLSVQWNEVTFLLYLFDLQLGINISASDCLPREVDQAGLAADDRINTVIQLEDNGSWATVAPLNEDQQNLLETVLRGTQIALASRVMTDRDFLNTATNKVRLREIISQMNRIRV